MEMLQLNDLHKTFNPGTVNEKVALNGVSLHMEAGDFATIVGSNGAGKSTLFNAITGGFIADEGSILLGGQDITLAALSFRPVQIPSGTPNSKAMIVDDKTSATVCMVCTQNPIPQIKSKPSKVRTAVPFPAFHQAKATIPTIIR